MWEPAAAISAPSPTAPELIDESLVCCVLEPGAVGDPAKKAFAQNEVEPLLRQIRGNAERHKQKIDNINNRVVPKSLLSKVDEAKEMLKNESNLLTWMESKSVEMSQAKQQYQEAAKLIANKKLYSGVSVKLNNRNWRSEREYDRAQVSYDMHQWKYEPLV